MAIWRYTEPMDMAWKHEPELKDYSDICVLRAIDRQAWKK